MLKSRCLRLSALLAAVVMVVSLCASCGEGSSDDGKTKLVIWAQETDDVLFGAIADYEDENPDVRIVIETQGSTSLDMAIQAETAPDIIWGPSDYVATYGEKGQVLDLTEFGADEVRDLFTDACWNVANAVPDKIYSLPFDSNIINFVINRDMFDAAGATVPTTYEEMITAANKIKAHFTGDGYYAYTAPYGCGETLYKAWGTFQYYWWLWRMGGDIFNEDQTKCIINEQAGVDALQRLTDMIHNGLAPATYAGSEFYTGAKIAMIEDTTTGFFNVGVASNTANFEIAMMPVLKEGVDPWTGMGLYCYSVVSTSENPELAYDFVEFLCTGVDYQITYCKPYYFIPSLIEAQEDSYFKTSDWKVVLEQAKYAKATPGVDNWISMDDAIYDAINQAFTGAKTPQAALDAVAAQVDSLLNK
ncbi:MAG: sugar ABC transporter substrate-binding protein [Oscillospiraceae bacterium]|nr:sugar ABC transporter substrate-binding protein [Oscillospiraceae bacterium]